MEFFIILVFEDVTNEYFLALLANMLMEWQVLFHFLQEIKT